MQLNFDLDWVERDPVHEDERNTFTTINIKGYHIEIGFEGYGEHPATDGAGSPVVIEVRDGVPHVLIFGDINQEGPTHSISLAGAAESKRKADAPERPYFPMGFEAWRATGHLGTDDEKRAAGTLDDCDQFMFEHRFYAGGLHLYKFFDRVTGVAKWSLLLGVCEWVEFRFDLLEERLYNYGVSERLVPPKMD